MRTNFTVVACVHATPSVRAPNDAGSAVDYILNRRLQMLLRRVFIQLVLDGVVDGLLDRWILPKELFQFCPMITPNCLTCGANLSDVLVFLRPPMCFTGSSSSHG